VIGPVWIIALVRANEERTMSGFARGRREHVLDWGISVLGVVSSSSDVKFEEKRKGVLWERADREMGWRSGGDEIRNPRLIVQ
jgi:hypothetical protein